MGLKNGAREYLDNRKASWAEEARSYSWLDWAAVFLPCITWLRTYNVRRNLLVSTPFAFSTCDLRSGLILCGV